MSHNQKQLGRTMRWGGPCPACGHKMMVRKTRDADSPLLEWIECESENCNYEADFQAFRTAWLAARQAP